MHAFLQRQPFSSKNPNVFGFTCYKCIGLQNYLCAITVVWSVSLCEATLSCLAAQYVNLYTLCVSVCVCRNEKTWPQIVHVGLINDSERGTASVPWQVSRSGSPPSHHRPQGTGNTQDGTLLGCTSSSIQIKAGKYLEVL